MSCDEISADWAAQRIKGLDLGAAIRDAVIRTLAAGAQEKRRRGDQDADRIVPLPAPRTRHDVGRRSTEDTREGRQRRARPLGRSALLGRDEAALDGHRPPRRRHDRSVDRGEYRLVGGAWRPRPRADAVTDQPSPRARAALPRLPHRRADRRKRRAHARQLDLHPRSVGEGRARAELCLVVAGDGSRPALRQPRHGIFLLRGRRALVDGGRRPRSRWRKPRSRRSG